MLACLSVNPSSPGMPSVMSLLALGGAVLALIIFVRAERKAVEPLLPLWLFRDRVFLAGVLWRAYLPYCSYRLPVSSFGRGYSRRFPLPTRQNWNEP